jgi:hypothetical protein
LFIFLKNSEDLAAKLAFVLSPKVLAPVVVQQFFFPRNSKNEQHQEQK